MKHYRKNLFLILIIIPIILATIYFLHIKSTASKIEFENFINSYKTGEINTLDNYTPKFEFENIKEIISEQKLNTDNETAIKILDTFQNLIYSISFNVTSTKTILNKSTLNVNFNYYDLSKHIINYFKNQDKADLKDFLNSLQSTKYKVYTNLDVNLKKEDGKWKVILSEKLLNILTGGLYKNFVI